MFARLTIAAAEGLASGTLMISMRHSADVSTSGLSRVQPGSSVGDRSGAEPET